MHLPRVVVLAAALLCSRSVAAGQGNDHFSDRIKLSGTGVSAVADNRQATTDPGEPDHAGTPAGRSVWWSWTAPATDTVNISGFGTLTDGSSPLRLAAYTGDAVGALSEVGSNNGPGTRADFNLEVVAGTTYHLALDTGINSGTEVAALSINAAPTITSGATAMSEVGRGFSYVIEASNSPERFAATGLPPGLFVNEYTGGIEGTPSQTGVYTVGLSAQNGAGLGTAVLTLTINPADPVGPDLSTELSVRTFVGEDFSWKPAGLGSPVGIQATGLPAGLFVTADGQINGSATTAGTYPVTITASSPQGTSTAVLTIVVDALPRAPVITSPATARGRVGSPFSYEFAVAGKGISAPTRYDARDLPPGLGLDLADGAVEGIPLTAGTYSVPISATNSGGVGTAVVTISIEPANTDPNRDLRITSAASIGAVAGNDFTYRVTADGNPTEFSAAGLPSGLSINPQTGVITGIPAAAGEYPVLVGAANSQADVEATVTISVREGGGTFSPLGVSIISPASSSGTVGADLTYWITVTSPYRTSSFTPESYSALELPPGLSLDSSKGVISGIPSQAGTYATKVFVTGSYTFTLKATAEATITFVIGPANSAPAKAPVITSPAGVSGSVNSFFVYGMRTSPEAVTYSASGLPPGLAISSTSGGINGYPTAPGDYPVSISASNANGVGTATVLIRIGQAKVPQISGQAWKEGSIGELFDYTIGAPSGATVACGNLPIGLTFDSNSRKISGVPTAKGVFEVPYTVSNNDGTSGAVITIAIGDARPPVITSEITAIGSVGSTFQYTIVASGSGNTFQADNLPSGLLLDAGTGKVSGTPVQAGRFAVPIRVTGVTGSSEAVLRFLITPASSPVFTNSVGMAGAVGVPFSRNLNASGAASYGAENLPPGLVLDPSTGRISGTPTTSGTYYVPVSAANSVATGNATITIVIAAERPPAPPVITSAPMVRIALGEQLSYRIAATNAPTGFSASGLPAGLNTDTTNGMISGKPTTSGIFPVTITAANADGEGSASLTIEIGALPTEVPVITTSAGLSAVVGTPVSFTLAARNLPTSFSASNLPPGLNLDSESGVVSGTPTSAGVWLTQVTATNAAGSGVGTIRFVIQGSGLAPRFTSSAAVGGLVGRTLSYTVAADVTGSYYYSLNNSPLPPGLTFNPSTKQITGVPTKPGRFTVNASALSSSNNFPLASAVITLDIAAQPQSPPTVTSSAAGVAYVGADFRYVIRGSEFPSKFTATGLPPGLSFDEENGVIYGRPAVIGEFFIPISAANEVGTSLCRYFLKVLPLPSPLITSSATATGTAGGVETFSYKVVASNGPNLFSATGLPPGLSLDTASGVVTGVPTAPGFYQARVTATNSAGSTDATIGFLIRQSTARLLSSAMWSGSVGVPFSAGASINSSEYSTTFTDLPPGLYPNLIGTAVVGVPSKPGVFHVTVTMTSKFESISEVVTVLIDSRPAIPKPSSHSPVLSGEVGTSFGYRTFVADTGERPSVTATGLPPGLTVAADSGYIRGVPSMAGSFPATITFQNSTGVVTEKILFVIKDRSVPVITSALSTTGMIGSPLTYTVTGGDADTTFSAAGLPPGLSIHPRTGLISGAPSSVGVSFVDISAANPAGVGTARIRFEITNAEARPVITSPASAVVLATPGVNSMGAFNPPTDIGIDYLIVATNGPTRFTATDLPAGLSFDESHGRIYGTPNAIGTYRIPISASNVVGKTDAVLTLYVLGNVRALGGPANAMGEVGEPIAYQPYVPATFRWASPFQLTFGAVNLPPGLSVNRDTGLVTGTPTVAGTFQVNFRVRNIVGVTNSIITFVIRPATLDSGRAPDLKATPASFNAVLGIPFEAEVRADRSPDRLEIASLPPGLSFKIEERVVNGRSMRVGVVFGVPSSAGSFVVPVTAANSAGTSTATLTIAVAEQPPSPTVSGGAIARGIVGRYLRCSVTTITEPTSALAPRTYTASNLPAGLQIDAKTGQISGVPTAAGTSAVPLTVSVRGVTGSATLTIIISAGSAAPDVPRVSAPAGAYGFIGVPFKVAVSAVNRPDTLEAASLPPGLSFSPMPSGDASSDDKHAIIRGIPTAAGTYAVPISAANSNGTSGAVMTIRIVAPQVARPSILQHPVDLKVELGKEAAFAVIAAGSPAVSYQWSRNGVPIPGATDGSLRIPAAGVGDDGVYRVQVSNLAGTVESSPAELAVMIAYDSWMNFQFTSEEIASGRAGTLADFNRDGICNLLEYAFARDPRTGRGGELPRLSLIPGTSRVRLQFRRDTRKADVNYTVEASSDLTTWTPIARSVAGGPTASLGGAGNIVETGGTLRTVVVDDGPEGAGASVRFLRVKVERQ